MPCFSSNLQVWSRKRACKSFHFAGRGVVGSHLVNVGFRSSPVRQPSKSLPLLPARTEKVPSVSLKAPVVFPQSNTCPSLIIDSVRQSIIRECVGRRADTCQPDLERQTPLLVDSRQIHREGLEGTFCDAPVLKTSTSSAGLMLPPTDHAFEDVQADRRFPGQMLIPSAPPAPECIQSPIEASRPGCGQAAAAPDGVDHHEIAVPPAGTRRPLAIVLALGKSSAKRNPASKALTIGAQPSAWQLMRRGILSPGSQPSSRSS